MGTRIYVRQGRNAIYLTRTALTFMIALVSGLAVLMGAFHAAAQEEPPPPDYAIRNIRSQLDAGMVIVQFDVVNDGGAATSDAVARLLDVTGQTIVSDVISPLQAASIRAVRLAFPAYLFQQEAGTRISLTATVGVGEVEPPGSPLIGNNTARVGVDIPEDVAPPAPGVPDGGAQVVEPAETVLGISMDPTTRLTIAAVVAIGGVLLILLWVTTVILRLLFARPATFPHWQPPYTSSAYIDPNSLHGRRQLWQPHAQSDLLPMPCVPGTFAARKALISANGTKLSGWRVKGVRLNQYDSFGRIARSQVIGDNGLVKRVDRAVRKSATFDAKKAGSAMRPVANKLAKQFTGNITRKSAGLPVALDVRLDGQHGEVRIIFELHECTGNGYHRVDQWEPEMVVTDKGIIHENYSYTLYGQRGDESKAAFRKRLRDDMTRTLVAMVQRIPPPLSPPKPQTPAKQSQPTIPLAPTELPPEAGQTLAQDTAEIKAVGENTPTSNNPPTDET